MKKATLKRILTPEGDATAKKNVNCKTKKFCKVSPAIKTEKSKKYSHTATNTFSTAMANRTFSSLISSSDVLDVVLDEKIKSEPPDDTENGDMGYDSPIATNMLAAVKTVSMNIPQSLKFETNPKKLTPRTSQKGRRRESAPPIRDGITPVRYTTTSISSAKKGQSSPRPKTGRVIGKEMDIRKQLLSSFSAVAAAKAANQGNPHPMVFSNILIPSVSTTPKTPKVLPKVTVQVQPQPPPYRTDLKGRRKDRSRQTFQITKTAVPRVYPSKKPSRQNIAFADPSRKVAVAVESMLSSAITKVMNTHIPIYSQSPNLLNSQMSSIETKKRRRKTKGRSRLSPADEGEYDDDDDESGFDLKQPPWETDNESNDEGSDTYEEIEGDFGSQVKVEVICDESETEYDYDKFAVKVPGEQFVNTNDDTGELEVNNQDPLAMDQLSQEADVNTTSQLIGEIEPGGDSIKMEQQDAQYDLAFFGTETSDEHESKETDQPFEDVKPQILPPTDVEKGTVNTWGVKGEFITSELSEPKAVDVQVKTERPDTP